MEYAQRRTIARVMSDTESIEAARVIRNAINPV